MKPPTSNNNKFGTLNILYACFKTASRTESCSQNNKYNTQTMATSFYQLKTDKREEHNN